MGPRRLRLDPLVPTAMSTVPLRQMGYPQGCKSFNGVCLLPQQLRQPSKHTQTLVVEENAVQFRVILRVLWSGRGLHEKH